MLQAFLSAFDYALGRDRDKLEGQELQDKIDNL